MLRAMRRPLLLLPLLALLASCAPLQQALQVPEVRVSGLRLNSLRLPSGPDPARANVTLHLRVSNPNRVGARLANIAGTLVVDGAKVGDVKLPDVRLPAGGEAAQDAELNLPLTGTSVASFLKVARGQEVSYRLDGTFTADLGALVVVSLFVVKAVFVGVIVVAVVVGLWELTSRLQERKGIRAPLIPLAIGGAAMVVAGYARGAEGAWIAMALTALAVLVWRMAQPPEDYLRDVTAGIFAAFYVPFLATFVALLIRSAPLTTSALLPLYLLPQYPAYNCSVPHNTSQ